MNEFRITKHDPRKRDSSGAYLDLDEWTCFSEVGGKVTKEEYEKIETAYINSAIELVFSTPEKELTIRGLEDHKGTSGLCEGDKITEESAPTVLRKALRNECWCRLESDSAFIHFGWDYYMYVGVSEINESTLDDISGRGLYLEEFTSPYHPEIC